MKFFVTGRSSNYSLVEETFDEIEKRGHQVTLRWTDFPMVKPYSENSTVAGQYAEQQIQGIDDADVFILFAHEDGNGVFSEFGAALMLAQKFGQLKIYAVGPASLKEKAMFHYHPSVKWKISLNEVFDELGI